MAHASPAPDPVVLVESVEILETNPVEPLLWFGIDNPVTSSRFSGYDCIISGWAVHPSRVVESVQLVSGHDLIGCGRIGLPRPDLAARLPDIARAATSGFQFAAGMLTLPREFVCTIEATLDDGRRVALARLRGIRPGLPHDDSAMLQPILVSSLGRSGSTLLLGMLAAHPSIVVTRTAPYETRASSYWLQVFQVLSGPADHEHAGDRGSFLNDPHFVGHNPFNMANRDEPALIRTWYARSQVERVAAFCRSSVESFYRTLAQANGQSAPTYFAEKRLTGVLDNPLGDLYPRGREIFLVRDFRDVVASIFAINTRRGYDAFGRQHFASDEDYIRRLAVWATQLQEGWRRREQSSCLLRYEDLVTTPRQALVTVLEYLEVESGSEVIDAMTGYVQSVPELVGHKTSPDAASSIGRWRADIDERLQSVCADEFGTLLSEFGYDTR